ncbi:MAG: hypothetical protein WBG66_05465 [Geitlerinemataceae cyanobacterium]
MTIEIYPLHSTTSSLRIDRALSGLLGASVYRSFHSSNSRRSDRDRDAE